MKEKTDEADTIRNLVLNLKQFNEGEAYMLTNEGENWVSMFATSFFAGIIFWTNAAELTVRTNNIETSLQID